MRFNKKRVSQLMLGFHLLFAILAIVRFYHARANLGDFVVPGSVRTLLLNYLLTVIIATWTGLLISLAFYYFSKFSAVIGISLLTILYYLYGAAL